MVLSSNVAAIKALKDGRAARRRWSRWLQPSRPGRCQRQGDAAGHRFTSGNKPLFLDDPTKAMRARSSSTRYDKTDPPRGRSSLERGGRDGAGLQEAGQNPTHQSFIENLLKVKDYTMGGLLGAPVDFSKTAWIEQATNANCMWIAVLEGDKFVAIRLTASRSARTLIPGTEQA
jgi:hypothetical protein